MASGYFFTNLEFNMKMFKENELNRWKFLEENNSNEVGYLMKSPIPVITLTISYILFVKIIGPWLMTNREPFQLKTIIRFYNLVMVFLAGLLFYYMYQAVGSFGDMFDNKKMFSFEDKSSTKIYRAANFVLFVRLSEYLDTIFFTLRKKQNQVTFLHVFHHAFVPIYAYWILRTAPTRYNTYIILINSLVHVIMYFYYFLATFQEPRSNDTSIKKKEPSFIMMIVNKILFYKKYITQLQIIQFVTLVFYAVSVCFRQNRCGVPLTYLIANLLLSFMFIGLFLHFYMNVYKVPIKNINGKIAVNNKSRID